MTQFQVLFFTEAATLDDAVATVSTWVITEGTVLHSVTGSVTSDIPVVMAKDGPVSEAVPLSEVAPAEK